MTIGGAPYVVREEEVKGFPLLILLELLVPILANFGDAIVWKIR